MDAYPDVQRKQYSFSLLLFALLLSVAAVFVIIIWNIKADFYEDAMSKVRRTRRKSFQTLLRKKA